MVVVKNDSEVNGFDPEMEGAINVTMQILIGPDDGSRDIIMRRFELREGGETPYHTHDFAHVVKVLEGDGTLRDKNGEGHPLKPGMSAFVPGGERHQFLNSGKDPFAFLCIILNQDRGPRASIH